MVLRIGAHDNDCYESSRISQHFIGPINTSSSVYHGLKHPSDNESYPTCNISIYYKCGFHNRKCIDGTGEHHGLSKWKKDLFSGSNPHFPGHLQIHSDLVVHCTRIGFIHLHNFDAI